MVLVFLLHFVLNADRLKDERKLWSVEIGRASRGYNTAPRLSVCKLLQCLHKCGQWAGPLDLYGKEYDGPTLHQSPSHG